MTTINTIRTWLKEAPENKTHMLVVCDTFDYEDYPVYTDNLNESLKKYQNASMQKVMEVYNLHVDIEAQLDAARTWNV